MKYDFKGLTFPLCAVLMAALFSVGCQSVYYKTMEKVGYQKHEILVDRVAAARDGQQEAKEQFQSTLERFNEVVNIDSGVDRGVDTGVDGRVLEKKYDVLNAEYKKCEKKANNVRKRIDAVEDVGEALFKEWEVELNQYSSANLRNASRQKMDQTRREYDQLIQAMHRAQRHIEPVLSAFRDQVLFLKHNLNASAIASLKNELVTVETDVASLIKETEAAIAEADGFIKTIAESNAVDSERLF
ncbi:MAG: DUF2959 domain-containing protein [Desulfosalsimonadaceae bacterium]